MNKRVIKANKSRKKKEEKNAEEKLKEKTNNIEETKYKKEMKNKGEIKVITLNDKEYPKRLLQIEYPPKQLYIKGNVNLLNNDMIAIVGTRNYTEYGKKCASIFAKELSKNNVCIVSGMAEGIDSIAHINSMENVGKTVAVMGSGFNYIFPEKNKYLYEKIIENGGCVVTEYPIDTEANKENFPRRNRIVAGLSMGVLVIEARYHSGTSITARFAKNQGKEIFCIPHEINSPTGYMPNFLIQNGAKLVTAPEEILNFYYSDEILIPNEQTEQVPQEYQEIYNLIGELPISANEICKRINKTISVVSETLVMLELNGYIKGMPGNYYVRVLKSV